MRVRVASGSTCYLAGPFFNSFQVRLIEGLKEQIELSGFSCWSPRDEMMFVPGKTTPEEVLAVNIKGLQESSFMVCVTDGKDPGTMFEAGWAFANQMPIIYVWVTGEKGQKFNLMLASTGSVVRSFASLSECLSELDRTEVFVRKNWSTEEMDYE